MSVKRYRLKAPTMAVERGSDGRMQLVTVPEGAIVQVEGEPQQSGLVDVIFDNRNVAMFFRDIGDRGEKFLVKEQL